MRRPSHVLIETDHLILRSLLVFDWKKNDADRKQDNDILTVVLQDASSILNACDTVLSSNREEDIQKLRGLSDEGLHEPQMPIISTREQNVFDQQRSSTCTLSTIPVRCATPPL